MYETYYRLRNLRNKLITKIYGILIYLRILNIYHIMLLQSLLLIEYCRAAEFKNVDRDDVCILFVLVTDP